jgi:hypothetical protein
MCGQLIATCLSVDRSSAHTCRADNCETEDIICRPVVVSVEVYMNNCYMFSVLYANHDIYVHVQFQTLFAICVQVLCHH